MKYLSSQAEQDIIHEEIRHEDQVYVNLCMHLQSSFILQSLKRIRCLNTLDKGPDFPEVPSPFRPFTFVSDEHYRRLGVRNLSESGCEI